MPVVADVVKVVFVVVDDVVVDIVVVVVVIVVVVLVLVVGHAPSPGVQSAGPRQTWPSLLVGVRTA